MPLGGVTNFELAAYLQVDPRDLTRKCSKAKGSYFAQITREILLNEFYNLDPQDRDYLLTILKGVMSSGIRVSGFMDKVFHDGILVYAPRHLNASLERYANQSRYNYDNDCLLYDDEDCPMPYDDDDECDYGSYLTYHG